MGLCGTAWTRSPQQQAPALSAAPLLAQPAAPSHKVTQPRSRLTGGWQAAAEELGPRPGASFQSRVPADRVGIMSPWDFSPQASTELGPGAEHLPSPPGSALVSPTSGGPSTPRDGSLAAGGRPGDKFLAEDGAPAWVWARSKPSKTATLQERRRVLRAEVPAPCKGLLRWLCSASGALLRQGPGQGLQGSRLGLHVWHCQQTQQRPDSGPG